MFSVSVDTHEPIRILAISGSLRRASSNGALVGAVARLAPQSVEVSIYRGLGTLPPWKGGFDPEALLLHTDDVILIERAMSNLSTRFRELLVLRELEELSYQEVADVMGVPIGTVMSGLSRARQALRGALDSELKRCPAWNKRAAR